MIASELDFVDVLGDFLRSDDYKIRLEVPNMGQSADIVASRGRYVTVIEAKLSDWVRGLRQCVAHEHVADFVCLALAREHASSELKGKISELGYGLILCSPKGRECRWEIKPSRNQRVWKPQRRYWSRALRNIRYAD